MGVAGRVVGSAQASQPLPSMALVAHGLDQRSAAPAVLAQVAKDDARREASTYSEALGQVVTPLAPQKYRTIVADPPWDVKRPAGWGTTENHRAQPYPVMSVDEIASLPVDSLADPVSFLFLWTVNAYVEAAYSVARAWGFRPVTLLTWCKEPNNRFLGGYFTTTTEFILHARRGSWPAGRTHAVDTSWFVWPRGKQSEKPEAFMDMVETHFPSPRLEMFSRRPRLGWDTHGNESLGHVEVPS